MLAGEHRDDSLVEFVGHIRLLPEDWDDCDGDHLEQAVQNVVGPLGVEVVSAEYLEQSCRDSDGPYPCSGAHYHLPACGGTCG